MKWIIAVSPYKNPPFYLSHVLGSRIILFHAAVLLLRLNGGLIP